MSQKSRQARKAAALLSIQQLNRKRKLLVIAVSLLLIMSIAALARRAGSLNSLTAGMPPAMPVPSCRFTLQYHSN